MKTFYNEYWTDNEDGKALYREATSAIEVLFNKYIAMGYNAREISNQVAGAVLNVEASCAIRHAVELHQQRQERSCPQHGRLKMLNGVCHGTHRLPKLPPVPGKA
jgi:hypothetical protein